nr:reverse transcriptase domain-containing protein [Tanacetum cinerariifolium]
MTEDDKEKTRFHMEEGVYCFTHMPKELKNSAATLQRIMEKVLDGLAASIRKGMKDLHVFMDSPKLVSQTEGNHMPATEQKRKYKKEIIDAIALSTESIDGYQNKTIGGRDKQQQEGKSNKQCTVYKAKLQLGS